MMQINSMFIPELNSSSSTKEKIPQGLKNFSYLFSNIFQVEKNDLEAKETEAITVEGLPEDKPNANLLLDVSLLLSQKNSKKDDTLLTILNPLISDSVLENAAFLNSEKQPPALEVLPMSESNFIAGLKVILQSLSDNSRPKSKIIFNTKDSSVTLKHSSNLLSDVENLVHDELLKKNDFSILIKKNGVDIFIDVENHSTESSPLKQNAVSSIGGSNLNLQLPAIDNTTSDISGNIHQPFISSSDQLTVSNNLLIPMNGNIYLNNSVFENARSITKPIANVVDKFQTASDNNLLSDKLTSDILPKQIDNNQPLPVKKEKTESLPKITSSHLNLKKLNHIEFQSTKQAVSNVSNAEKKEANINLSSFKLNENKSAVQFEQLSYSAPKIKVRDTLRIINNPNKDLNVFDTSAKDLQPHNNPEIKVKNIISDQSKESTQAVKSIISDQSKESTQAVKSIISIKELMEDVKVESIFVRETEQTVKTKTNPAFIVDKNSTGNKNTILKSTDESSVIFTKQNREDNIQNKLNVQHETDLTNGIKPLAAKIIDHEISNVDLSKKGVSIENPIRTTQTSSVQSLKETNLIPLFKSDIQNNFLTKSEPAIEINEAPVKFLNKAPSSITENMNRMDSAANYKTEQQYNLPIESTLLLGESEIDAFIDLKSAKTEDDLHIKTKTINLKTVQLKNDSENIFEVRSEIENPTKAKDNNSTIQQIKPLSSKQTSLNDAAILDSSSYLKENTQKGASSINQFVSNRTNTNEEVENSNLKSSSKSTLNSGKAELDTEYLDLPNKEVSKNIKIPVSKELLTNESVTPNKNLNLDLDTLIDIKTTTADDTQKLGSINKISIENGSKIMEGSNTFSEILENKNRVTITSEKKGLLHDEIKNNLTFSLKSNAAPETSTSFTNHNTNTVSSELEVNSTTQSVLTEKISANKLEQSNANSKIKIDSPIKYDLSIDENLEEKIFQNRITKIPIIENQTKINPKTELNQERIITQQLKTDNDQTTNNLPEAEIINSTLTETASKEESLNYEKSDTNIRANNQNSYPKISGLKTKVEFHNDPPKIQLTDNSDAKVIEAHSIELHADQKVNPSESIDFSIEQTVDKFSLDTLIEKTEPKSDLTASLKTKNGFGTKIDTDQFSKMNDDPDFLLSKSNTKTERLEKTAKNIFNEDEEIITQIQKQNLTSTTEEEIISTEPAEKIAHDFKLNVKNKSFDFHLKEPPFSKSDEIENDIQPALKKSVSDTITLKSKLIAKSNDEVKDDPIKIFQNSNQEKIIEPGSNSDSELITKTRQPLELSPLKNNKEFSPKTVNSENSFTQEMKPLDHITDIQEEQVQSKPNDIHIKIKIEQTVIPAKEEVKEKFNPFLIPLEEIKKFDSANLLRGNKQSSKPSVELKSPSVTKDFQKQELKKTENKPEENHFTNHENPKENNSSYKVIHNQTAESFEIKQSLFNGDSVQYKTIRQTELIKEIYQMVEAGDKKSVFMKLVPEELGSLKILIDTVDSKVTAKIEVENESVQKFVQSNVESLKQSLQQTGVQLNALTVSLASSEQKNQNLNGNKKRNQPAGNSKKLESGDEKAKTKNLGYNTYEYLA